MSEQAREREREMARRAESFHRRVTEWRDLTDRLIDERDTLKNEVVRLRGRVEDLTEEVDAKERELGIAVKLFVAERGMRSMAANELFGKALERALRAEFHQVLDDAKVRT